MATNEYNGPDLSFVENREKQTYEIRVRYSQQAALIERRLADSIGLTKAKQEEERLRAIHKRSKNEEQQLKEAIQQRQQLEQEFQVRAQKIYTQRLENEQKNWTVLQRKQHQASLQAAAEEYKQQLEADIQIYKNKSRLDDQEKARLDNLRKQRVAIEETITKSKAEQAKYDDAMFNALSAREKYEKAKSGRKDAESQRNELQQQVAAAVKLGLDTEELNNQINELTARIEKLTEVEESTKKDAAREKANSDAEQAAEQAEEDKLNKTAEARRKLTTAEGWKETGKETLNKSLEKLGGMISDGLNQIDSKITTFYELQGRMNARLQGATDKNSDALSYESMTKNISKALKISGAVKQTDVITNLQKLIDLGVAYNVEGRAFLATIADNVASTFDASNPDLLRLIRLQQSETTAARLGLEASLTKLFNEYFSDTSYLSQAFDSVSSALMDVNATLSGKDSVALEYVVQKWLGALSSLGLSESAASTIAQGISYLGTGNVNALNNNSALQTLFAMSAGSAYSDLLVGGIDAESTNTLLRNMVVYLKSIADNTNNNMVTKSAYADLLGISVADLTAISNIREDEIDNLYANTQTYEQLYQEAQNQLNQVTSRMHISQIIGNAVDNALTTAATGIGGTSGVYMLWKAINIVEGITGGIDIPFINAMGFGVDLNTKITTIMKTAIAGISLIGQLMSGPSSGGLDLDTWGFDQYTGRGADRRKPLKKGSLLTISSSGELSSISSGSGNDMQDSSLQSAADASEDTAAITNKQHEGGADIYEQIYEAIGKDTGTSAIAQLMLIQKDVEQIKDNSAAQVISDLVSSSAILVSEIGAVSAFNAAEQSASRDKGLSVILSGLNDETKRYFEQMVKTMLASAFAEQLSGNAPEGEEGKSIFELFKELLTNVNVTVTNDWFDNVLQRSAFGG